MSERCETSDDDRRRWFDETIERYGWVLSDVEPDDGSVPWMYTVGLAEGFNHPELIVVGMRDRAAARTLNELGERVRNGLRLTTDSVPEVGDHLFTVGPVDPDQFELGALALWRDYYEEHRRTFVPRAALQLFAPPCLVSYGDDPYEWRLDTPREVLGWNGSGGPPS